MSNAVFDFDVSANNILKLYDLYQNYNYKKKPKKFDALDIMIKKIAETHEKMIFIELKSNYVRVLCLWFLKTDINRSDIKKTGVDAKKIADFFDLINLKLQESPEKAFIIVKQIYTLYLEGFYEKKEFRSFIANLDSLVSSTSEKKFSNVLLTSFFEKPNIFVAILDSIKLYRESIEKKSININDDNILADEINKEHVEENITDLEAPILVSMFKKYDLSTEKLIEGPTPTAIHGIEVQKDIGNIYQSQIAHDNTKTIPVTTNEQLVTNYLHTNVLSNSAMQATEIEQSLIPDSTINASRKDMELIEKNELFSQKANISNKELYELFQETIRPLINEIKVIRQELEVIRQELKAIKESEQSTPTKIKPISLELTPDHLKTIIDYFVQLSKK